MSQAERQLPEQLIDDTIGAQFTGAVDLAENIGLASELLQRVGEIYAEQVGLAVSDGQQMLAELVSSRTPPAAMAAVTRHLGRRIHHLATGMLAMSEAIATEQERVAATNAAIWKSFTRSL
ncbi:MAG: hypothetical protein ACFHX7_05460 [Pseudomonadota bacterium]